jgi:hypothetical protein
MFKVNDRVRVRETAFPRSDDPDDLAARGKIGTITQIEGDVYDVEVKGFDFPFLMLEHEIELVVP